MTTTPSDYLELLYRIQDPNRPTTFIQLPKDETIYEIDLNKRIINAPEFLSIEHDHNAETIYFKVDRYHDNIDLARSDIHVIIQYENASPRKEERGYIYAPPFIDISTFADEDKIIIPWVIEGAATAYSGNVKFSFKFYKIEKETDDNGETDYVYRFNLNTLVSSSKVLNGMDILETSGNYSYDADTINHIYAEIDNIRQANDLYWIEL